MRARRNQRTLGAADRQRLVAAIEQLKKSGVHDWFVNAHWHAAGMPNMMKNPVFAHTGPAFCPWHRRFILDYESQLQAADRELGGDGTLTLPYWDWTVDQGVAAAQADGTLWADDLMGPNGSSPRALVRSGPFAGWAMMRPPGDTSPSRLTRTLARFGSLPGPGDVAAALHVAVYDAPPFNGSSSAAHSFRQYLEANLHNPVHGWVGGTMDTMSSPNDPVFYLNHANVDRVWWEWQKQHPGPDNYPARAAGGTGPRQGHALDDPMPPWDGRSSGPDGKPLPVVTPRSVLDAAALGYEYQ